MTSVCQSPDKIRWLMDEVYDGHPYEEWVYELFKPYLSFEEAVGIRKSWESKKEWPKPKARKRGEVLKDLKHRVNMAWINQNEIPRMERHTVEAQGLIWLMGDETVLPKIWQIKYENDPTPKLLVICEEYGFDVPADAREAN